MTGRSPHCIRQLRDVPILASVPPRELSTLERGSSQLSRQAREFLYSEVMPARYAFIPARGRVRTCKTHPSGRVTTLEEFGPGELFGLAALLDAEKYGEDAQAQTDTVVWRIPTSVLTQLMASHPGLSSGVLALVAARLQQAHDRLCAFARGGVNARIARALLERDHGERIDITRQGLGEAAVTTVETTIRVLRRFARAGWIDSGTGWVRVRDRAALEDVMDGCALPPDPTKPTCAQ